MSPICPVCGSRDLSRLVTLESVPVYCNWLFETRAAATASVRGEIDLVFCEECTHVHNHAFDAALMEYSEQYENSLHFSPRFREYCATLSQRLVDTYDVRHKVVAEIGCGKGEFLDGICELGNNSGIGFDPTYEDHREQLGGQRRLEVVKDYYSVKYAHKPCDLVCCRHVLEHVETPVDFLRSVKAAVEGYDSAVMYFEVPNALFTLRDLGIWDLVYEHCAYFTPLSFYKVFSLVGFDVLRLEEEFGGQFLSLDAVLSQTSCHSIPNFPAKDEIIAYKTGFALEFETKLTGWKAYLEKAGAKGERVVAWGAGSKGITFLNIVDSHRCVEYIVDLNPHKQGKYVAGSGQKIVDPGFLETYQPDNVVVMNPIYVSEIERQLADLGLKANVIVA